MKYYPAFIDLSNKTAVVIGGGSVAERKVRSLIKAGAEIKVVSPALTKGLLKLLDRNAFTYINRNYRKGDLKKAFLVIAATSSSGANKKIASDADCLVNVIDMPSQGNFIVPSVLKQGVLTVAISTEGASPAMSKAIRKEIEGLYGKEFGKYLSYVDKVRQEALTKIKDSRQRKKFLNFLASDYVFECLRGKGFKETAAYISDRLMKESR